MELRTITKEELQNILKEHKLWLEDSTKGKRADLRSAELCNANLRNTGLLIFQYQQQQAHYTKDGSLTIGCLLMPITEWVLGYEEIGKTNYYSEEEIKAYGCFIKKCLGMFNKESI